MPTSALIGYGSRFKVEAILNSGTFTDVAMVPEITPPNKETTDVGMSHIQSPDSHMEFRPGMINPGEVSMQLIMEKNQFSTLLGYMDDRGTRRWKILFSDGTTEAGCSYWLFTAYIKTCTGEMPLDDKVTATFGFKLTGKPTFTVGSGS